MGFEIRVDAVAGIVEITYPARPTNSEIEAYVREIKAVMDRQPKGWRCLVDQRQLAVMPPDLVERVGELNAYGAKRGMARAARVIATSVANLQTARMARQASLEVPIKTFTSRDAAMAWLKGAD
jgi:stage II sporulation SpoAA-like protein